MCLSCSSLNKDFGEVGIKMMDKIWCVLRLLIDIDVYLSDKNWCVVR